MSNAVISSIGQVNSQGTADALFLKVFYIYIMKILWVFITNL